jgi:hypothetical protein
MGYYIQVFFDGGEGGFADFGIHDKWQTTTPGYVWPNTFPYEDCSSLEGASNPCIAKIV